MHITSRFSISFVTPSFPFLILSVPHPSEPKIHLRIQMYGEYRHPPLSGPTLRSWAPVLCPLSFTP